MLAASKLHLLSPKAAYSESRSEPGISVLLSETVYPLSPLGSKYRPSTAYAVPFRTNVLSAAGGLYVMLPML